MTENIEKKQVKILNLYYDLMNLYGDWANAAVLERELTCRGCDVVLDKKSTGDDVDLDIYDFIYIGSGTERSQIACINDLVLLKEKLFERIEAGVPVLAIGNSHEIFGKSVTGCDGSNRQTLGLLDFETVQLSTRVTGDCVFESKLPLCSEKLVGFINRAGGSQSGDIERPFSIRPGEGAGFSAGDEGIIYKNLLGTYMTGPILVRNPPMLKYFADLIFKHEKENSDVFFSFQEKAYINALSGLQS